MNGKMSVDSMGKRSWKVWWRLLRPHTLTAAFVPVTVGTALAFQRGWTIDLLLFILMFLASILIQSATNMFNEYYDFVSGLDTQESVGIGGTIVRDGVKAAMVLRLALSFYAVALVLGIYICYRSSWWLALVGLVCMAVGYLYTGGPHPIAATPFGELFSGIFMGLVIILISFFIQTKTIDLISVLVSAPVAVLICAILLANNIRDLDGDKAKGRHTLAIILGRNRAINFLSGLFIFSYFWSLSLIMLGILPLWCLLAAFSIPKALKAVRSFRGKRLPVEMMPAMQYVAQTNTIFGLLLASGLTIGHWF